MISGLSGWVLLVVIFWWFTWSCISTLWDAAEADLDD